MEAIKIEVAGNIARVIEKPLRITSGTVGLPVEFTFDSQWEGLSKIAVFQAGYVRKDMEVVDDATVVPMEITVKPNVRLNIGVYGVNEDGSVAIPTIWANAGQIRDGAVPGGSTGSDIGIAKKYYDEAMQAAKNADASAKKAESEAGVAETNADRAEASAKEADVARSNAQVFANDAEEAADRATEAAGRAEAAAEKIQLDQEYFDTLVFSVDQSAEIAASAARDAAAAKQSAKDDADRANNASKRAEEVAGSVGSPVSYKAQTLTKEEQAQARGNLGLAVFGAPYSSATKVIDISAGGDGSVKLYLFTVAEGFDAVVSGAGAIADYTEDNRPYDAQSICRLHIEKGITSIGSYFMQGAYNLKKLSFEDSKAITHLGANAFALTKIDGEYDFSGLTDATLNRVFFDCRKLEGVTLNGSITEIAANSFACCTSLRYINNIASEDIACTLRDGAFQYCTSLESLDVTPANTTLGNFVFLLTPINAKVGETETNLADAAWKSKGALMCFAQNEWASEQLTAIRGVTSESVQFPIPEADNQGAETYKRWGAFWNITRNWKDKHYGYNHCVYFSLFHIYNTLHPNAQYDTYYDFITREIAPRKIKVTQSLYDALHNSEVWDDLVALNEQYGTGVTYALGDEISATDLPISLKYEVVTHYEVGTAIWGVCEALGWSTEEIGFADGVQSGADVKRTILDNLANSKPTMMFIVGAGNEGHATHSVAAIGYDNETDRLRIIDSADGFPADTIPLAYWCAFEALITPDERSRVFTFDFGEVVSMTDIAEQLSILMQSVNSGFRTESGTIVLEKDILPASGQSYFAYTVPCSNGAKLFDFHADSDTLAAIKATTGTPYYTAILGNRFAPEITDNGGNMIGLLMHMREDIIDGTNYGWRPSNSTSFIKTTDGGVKFACYALKAGTYHWTAYYWDE